MHIVSHKAMRIFCEEHTPHVVFDIGKYRLIAEMNFARGVLFIRGILTHKEYMSATLTRCGTANGQRRKPFVARGVRFTRNHGHIGPGLR
ncbi:MAG: type II toxin-antitoxin system HigB family toxin [Candidatus Solibacter usitatus]|nr:type II toxin-antitoxin system HigB family toxin [Candidatus Solibacter usitatus]